MQKAISQIQKYKLLILLKSGSEVAYRVNVDVDDEYSIYYIRPRVTFTKHYHYNNNDDVIVLNAEINKNITW